MKKVKKSSFYVGQNVYLTKDYGRFFKNQEVEIVDNEKKGSEYTNKVRNALGTEADIPTKYLKA